MSNARDGLSTALAAIGAVTVVVSVAHSVQRLLSTRAERKHVKALEARLEAANLAVRQAEAKALAAEEERVVRRTRAPSTDKKKIRVYIDGCWDMLHFGHSNALRQARAAGDELVVGLINDAEVIANKGSAPVMNEDERFTALSANKFVTEVIPNAPYDLHKEWIDELVSKHNIDFVVHGDDPCITADGKDAYAYAKSIGRFKLIKRTEGVSTTDIVGRMLLMSREHHITDAKAGSSFLPTSRRITQFSSGRAPAPGDRVVYISGGWDLFNIGHIHALEQARTFGDFLLVGIHDDPTVNRLLGGGHPILNLHERTLSVLACKHVDEVIIGAPFNITEDLIKSMNIHVVVRGTIASTDAAEVDRSVEVPKSLGILRTFESRSPIKADTMIQRIMEKRDQFTRRYEAKSKKEQEYYQSQKTFLSEA